MPHILSYSPCGELLSCGSTTDTSPAAATTTTTTTAATSPATAATTTTPPITPSPTTKASRTGAGTRTARGASKTKLAFVFYLRAQPTAGKARTLVQACPHFKSIPYQENGITKTGPSPPQSSSPATVAGHSQNERCARLTPWRGRLVGRPTTSIALPGSLTFRTCLTGDGSARHSFLALPFAMSNGQV